MTRIDIDALRLQFEAACDAYYTHACKLIAQSKGGELPAPEHLNAETLALNALSKIRRELLDALEGVSLRH